MIIEQARGGQSPAAVFSLSLMDTANRLMTPAQIRHALVQRLASLQRSGVSQLPRITAANLPPLDPALLAQVSPAIANSPVANPTATPRPNAAPPPTPASVASSCAPTESSNSQSVPTQPATPQPALSQPSTLASVSLPRPASGSLTDLPRPSRKPAASSLLDAKASPRSQSNASLSPDERRLALEVIHTEVRDCTRCPQLVANRSRTVFGVGALTPRLCFFGEAPGADEDRQGIPFVGRAGQLLDKIIEAMGLRREEVYILNVLKCRPPDNRAPQNDEIENCRGYFERQLEVLKPEFVCCLGASAAKSMLHSAFSIGKMRGRFYDAYGAQVIVTYHPAYLLRNPAAKKDTWEDIQMLMKAMGLTLPSKE